MKNRNKHILNFDDSTFYECQYQLIDWIHGTNLLSEMVSTITQYANTFQQLYQWKTQNLIFPKPTLSSRYLFVFWANKSIIDSVMAFPGVRGGFLVQEGKIPLPDSSTYKGKKQNPRPRRVLLDINCDSPVLIQQLKQLGLEVVRLWDHAADLLHYEIIELCTNQYIDILVSTNERLLTPVEEWLDYLMPHRTRVCITSRKQLDPPEDLAQSIYHRVYRKRKFKTKNRVIELGKLNQQKKLGIMR